MKSKRSGFEDKCAALLEPAGFDYEKHKIPYEVSHWYTPDFVAGNVLVEAKGWFRPGDRQKYKAIQHSLSGEQWELVFLLQSPHKKVSKGAKLTMGGWCNKEGIKWFCMDTIEDLINYAVETQ